MYCTVVLVWTVCSTLSSRHTRVVTRRCPGEKKEKLLQLTTTSGPDAGHCRVRTRAHNWIRHDVHGARLHTPHDA